MKMQYTGYHSTHADNVSPILEKGFIDSTSKEWMGKGIYFFDTIRNLTDGKTEAIGWARFVKKYDTWAIFVANLHTDSYIDLVKEVEHRKIFDQVRKEAIRLHQQAGKGLHSFKESMIYVKMEDLDVDLIRALVDADGKGHLSYTVRRPQVQICVKNKACIKSYKVIHTEERVRYE